MKPGQSPDVEEAIIDKKARPIKKREEAAFQILEIPRRRNRKEGSTSQLTNSDR